MKRPLIDAGPVSPDEGHRTSAEFFSANHDYTWIPGYSDKRVERDQARQKGQRGPGLTHRYQFARATSPSGKPDSRDIFSWRAKGYREVKEAELGSLGIGMPPAGKVNADGTIAVMDTILMVSSAANAAKNEKDWRRATDERATTEAKTESLSDEGSKQGGPGESLTFSESESYMDTRESPK